MPKIVPTLKWAQGRATGFIAIAIAAVITSLLVVTLVTSDIEQSNKDIRSQAFAYDASGQNVIVEIDARSLGALGNWPWPRENHAALIDKLSAAGAVQIAFDVDFSSPSNAANDQKLAQSIANSNAPVILASFRQSQGHGSEQLFENIPISQLRENAMLASVNITLNPEGQADNYSYGETTGGVPRPSLAALLTDQSGSMGGNFPIDQSVRLETIPRLSVIDILNNDFGNEDIRGKNVIIGATAIELGDRYATPHWGVIPGVYLHGLAAETLLESRDISILSPWAVFAVFLVLAIFVWSKPKLISTRIRRRLMALCGFLAIGANWLLYWLHTIELEIGISCVFIAFLCVADLVLDLIGTIHHERRSDALTGLPNSEAMMEIGRSNSDCHICIAQVTNFTNVSALLSNEDSTALMLALARRFSLLARDHKIYRISDDQLGWFLDENYRSRIGEHFETACALALSPIEAGQDAIRLKTHFGYHRGNGADWFSLLSNASVAASRAAEHNYRWVKYSSDIKAIMNQKLMILSNIDQAMAKEQIWVAYQPKMDIASSQIASAEALVRWDHPEHGEITPDQFIPVLEDDGRIVDLTLFVLKTSIADVQKWSDLQPAISCSVNVSAILLHDKHFVASAIELVTQSTLSPGQITFELTETASLANLDEARSALETIRASGIGLSIDDYGTGQSNLSYMQELPADEIKIDQSFVKFMTERQADQVMVSSTIDMAHKMGYRVVAEGIEDAECLAMLRDLGCDTAQGWHIGKPANSADFARMHLEPNAQSIAARL